MTKNTLEYLKLLELIRNNNLIAQLRGAELAELIANNKRTFRVNMTRNQIERLANDQLDSRERTRINEIIRDNLARLEEERRHNMTAEEVSQYNAYTSRYEAVANQYSDPLTGWIRNNAGASQVPGFSKVSKSKYKVERSNFQPGTGGEFTAFDEKGNPLGYKKYAPVAKPSNATKVTGSQDPYNPIKITPDQAKNVFDSNTHAADGAYAVTPSNNSKSPVIYSPGTQSKSGPGIAFS